MSPQDLIQVWQYRTSIPDGHEWGEIETLTTETLDFTRRTITTSVTGWHEGERVSSVDVRPIAPSIQPADAHRYRERTGYRRIK